jgi:hypothetical protein
MFLSMVKMMAYVAFVVVLKPGVGQQDYHLDTQTLNSIHLSQRLPGMASLLAVPQSLNSLFVYP